MQQLFTELRPLYETTKETPHVIAFLYENGVGRGDVPFVKVNREVYVKRLIESKEKGKNYEYISNIF